MPWRPPPSVEALDSSEVDSESDDEDKDDDDVLSVSPHTGAKRRSIPSVRLADWGAQDTSLCKKRRGPLSTQEKLELLREHDKRWSILDSAHERTFRVSGQAGVYELQEGIFLMCDDYTDDDDNRVSSMCLPSLTQLTM